MQRLTRILRALPLLLISPVLVFFPWAAILLADFLWQVFGRKYAPRDTRPNTISASVVIPNWNGKDLLEKYLPSVIQALSGHPDNEVIVVDNGSSDGSADFVRAHFPSVRLLALPANLGFGGGSNAGFRAAKNDIAVLLNSDMRVEPDFLQPLLDGFTDEKVFAISCQIFFPDPTRKREETGLTQAWWKDGGIRVTHRLDEKVDVLFPCFYAGGGSAAFDRRKFLELGGFDELLKPFYVEDTDLGMMAWKRGWKVFYQPKSVVYHQHRGTIGKKFSPTYIRSVVQKNFLLFSWKNIHETGRISSHFFFAFAGALVNLFLGESLERPDLLALFKAFLQLPQALISRWRARSLSAITDTEAFRRPLGGYFRDRFANLPGKPGPLNVLFLSPYAICPPVHGGAVFMYQTCRELARLVRLHLLVLVDKREEIAPHKELESACQSAEYVIRLEGQPSSFGSLYPHAVHEYANADLEWLIHRQIYLQEIDAVQLDYLQLAQYHCDYRRIAQFLFEHDVYFQSIARQLPHMPGTLQRIMATYEYLRALRYELTCLPLFDRVQVCTSANKRQLLEFAPELAPIVDDHLRAGVTTASYPFTPTGRKPYTMLFLGSFRHAPNLEALYWFVNHCLPLVLAARPEARMIVIGSDPPPRYSLPDFGDALDLRGYADDILQPLAECAVFVCPILAGSGVRVKLLEAFAMGIPVVSTLIGAEGLAVTDGEFCSLADDPKRFAEKILYLFDHPQEAETMARRARAEVEAHWDIPILTRHLADVYRDVVEQIRLP